MKGEIKRTLWGTFIKTLIETVNTRAIFGPSYPQEILRSIISTQQRYMWQVRNSWSYTSTIPYVFVMWCLIKHIYLYLTRELVFSVSDWLNTKLPSCHPRISDTGKQSVFNAEPAKQLMNIYDTHAWNSLHLILRTHFKYEKREIPECNAMVGAMYLIPTQWVATCLNNS